MFSLKEEKEKNDVDRKLSKTKVQRAKKMFWANINQKKAEKWF